MDPSFRFKQVTFSYKPLIILVFSTLLAACGDESATSTGSDTAAEAPTIVSTTPADMATDGSRTDPVTATFTETILLSSIDNNRFTLEGPDGYVASSVRAYDTVATLTPDDSLTLLTPYTATLSSSISGLAGNALGAEYNWSFITEDGHWGRAARIESHSAGSSAFPQIAFDPQGNAMAVWFHSDGIRTHILANHYIAGTGWGTETRIESDGNFPATFPQVAMDAQGNSIAVWIQSDGSVFSIWANRFVPGIGWGTEGRLEGDDAGDAANPQIAMDAQGNTLTVWQQSDATRTNIWARRYVSGTLLGTGDLTLLETDNAGNAENPQIAMDAQGNALAVWQQADGSRVNIWANYFTPDSGWGTAELIENEDLGDAANPQLAMDALGNAIAVWQQSNGSRIDIRANYFTPDSGWGTAALIESEDFGNAANPQIAMNPQGQAIVVWRQSDALFRNIAVNRYLPGSGWGTVELIESNNTGEALTPHISIDSRGHAVAVWRQYDGSRYNIWANRYISGNGWSKAILIETDNAGNATNPQVVMDAEGKALAVWNQYDGNIDNIWVNWFE